MIHRLFNKEYICILLKRQKNQSSGHYIVKETWKPEKRNVSKGDHTMTGRTNITRPFFGWEFKFIHAGLVPIIPSKSPSGFQLIHKHSFQKNYRFNTGIQSPPIFWQYRHINFILPQAYSNMGLITIYIKKGIIIGAFIRLNTTISWTLNWFLN
jgi:hypothetical protein